MMKKSWRKRLFVIGLAIALSLPSIAAAKTASAGNAAEVLSTVSASADEKKIGKYKKQAKKLKKKIGKAVLASGAQERRAQYRAFEAKIDKIERRLDRVEDRWEAYWQDGRISRAVYRSMERKVEAVEDYLDGVEEALEAKFEYEFDD